MQMQPVHNTLNCYTYLPSNFVRPKHPQAWALLPCKQYRDGKDMGALFTGLVSLDPVHSVQKPEIPNYVKNSWI